MVEVGVPEARGCLNTGPSIRSASWLFSKNSWPCSLVSGGDVGGGVVVGGGVAVSNNLPVLLL